MEADTNADTISYGRSRGVSALELLIYVAALAILAAFTGPLFTRDQVQVQMDSAVESLEASIRAARAAARIYHSPVELHLPSGEAGPRFLSYSVPLEEKSRHLINAQSANFPLPDKVRLVAERQSIQFNSEGQAVPPVRLVLISDVDDRFRERIVVE